jgi:hypothetical protein
MQRAVNSFDNNFQRVKSLGSLYQKLRSITTPALDLTDILRSELVLAVSVLDSYVHDIVLTGMLEAYEDRRPRTKSFMKFSVSLDCVLKGLSPLPGQDWLRNEIHAILSFSSYQHPDRISQGLNLISEKKIWNEVSTILNRTPDDIRNQLALIVDRRNKIAHEADINPAYPETRWPIDKSMTEEAADFIESLVQAIHQIIV